MGAMAHLWRYSRVRYWFRYLGASWWFWKTSFVFWFHARFVAFMGKAQPEILLGLGVKTVGEAVSLQRDWERIGLMVERTRRSVFSLDCQKDSSDEVPLKVSQFVSMNEDEWEHWFPK